MMVEINGLLLIMFPQGLLNAIKLSRFSRKEAETQIDLFIFSLRLNVKLAYAVGGTRNNKPRLKFNFVAGFLQDKRWNLI